MLLVHRVSPRSSPGWIGGAQNEVGESFLGLCLGLSTVVLELSNNHSFSFLSSKILRRSLVTCVAPVLIFGVQAPLEARGFLLFFALSFLLSLHPHLRWTQLCSDSFYFVENSVPWGKYDNTVFRQLCLEGRLTEPAGWHYWNPKTCQLMESSCFGWNSYHSYDLASYISASDFCFLMHARKRENCGKDSHVSRATHRWGAWGCHHFPLITCDYWETEDPEDSRVWDDNEWVNKCWYLNRVGILCRQEE